MATQSVYFFHIPKTAGTSAYRFLEQSFPEAEICPWGLWDHLVTASKEDLGRWQVFRGHFLSHLESFLDRKLFTFTLLREPVARTISHYHHVRRSPEHPSHHHAVNMTLKEFCLHPSTRHMVENYQAIYLAKAPCDVRAVIGTLPLGYAERFQLQEFLQYPDDFSGSDRLLEVASKRLAEFEYVGITERLGQSLSEFSRMVGCAAPVVVERANLNPEGTSTDSVDASTLDLIRSLTAVDSVLYNSRRTTSWREI
jgi:hypothetical protein